MENNTKQMVRFPKFCRCGLLLMMILAVGLTACGGSKTPKAVTQYLKEDLKELQAIETQVWEGCDEASGMDDGAQFMELSTGAALLVNRMENVAKDVEATIDHDDVAEVHDIYMEYSEVLADAINLQMSGLSNRDESQKQQAAEKFAEAKELAQEYEEAVNDLAAEYDVEL